MALAVAAGAAPTMPADWTTIDTGRGLTAVVVRDPGAGAVAAEVWLGGGGDDGEAVAHLAEHVAIAQAGAAAVDGRVVPDATVLRATAATLDGALAPLWAVVGAERARPSAIARERRSIAAEPDSQPRAARLGAALWRRALRRPGGPASSTAHDLEAWWRDRWRGRPATLVVHGPVEPDAVARWVDRWPGRVAAAAPAPFAAGSPCAAIEDDALAPLAIVADRDGWACGLATAGLAGARLEALAARAVAAAAARIAGGQVELLAGARRGLFAIAGRDHHALHGPDAADRAAWSSARARARRAPIAAGFGVAGQVGLGQHLAGDPGWIARYRAAVAAVAPADALAILAAIDRRLAAAPIRQHARPRPPSSVRAPSPPAPAPAPTAIPPVQRATLPGGARLVVATEPGAPTVAFRIAWPGGLAAEAPDQRGIAAIAGATLATCARATVVDALGGSIAAVIERDRFGLRAELPAAAWRDGLAAVLACVAAPAPAPDRLDAERRRLDELAGAADGSALRLGLSAFARARFGDHPLARELTGAAAPYLTPGAVARWLAAHDPFGRAAIAVVGPVELAAVEAALAPIAIASAAPAAPAGWSPAPRVGGALGELFIDAAHDGGAIVVGFPALAAGDPDRAALEVAAAWLADPQGPLAELAATSTRLRVAVADTADAGYLALALDHPRDPEAAAAALPAALAALAATPPPPAAIAAIRDRLLAARAREPVRRRTWADDLAIAALLDAPDRHGALAAVDAAAVARALARVVVPAAATVAIVRVPDITPGVLRQRTRPVAPTHRRPHHRRAHP